MKPKLVIRSSAVRDLDEQALEYARRGGRELGHRFYAATDDSFAMLVDHAEIGSPCRFAFPGSDAFRVWPVSGFERNLIFHRVDEKTIEVVRVLHSARDLEKVLENERKTSQRGKK